MENVCCVVVQKSSVKAIKTILKEIKLVCKDFRITQLDDIHVAIPVSFKDCIISSDEHLQQELSKHDHEFRIHYMQADRLLSAKCITPRVAVVNFVRSYAENDTDLCTADIESVIGEIPHKWEIHGDLVLFPKKNLTSDIWSTQDESFWRGIAEVLHVNRMALISPITNDAFRTPRVEIKLGGGGWVEHVDNGVTYTYDVTKCMFSKGNITEKMRIGKLDCRDEVVVDLFAGIGYFTLPYLVKAGAKKIYACEWNPDAIDALKRGLELNHVTESRYEILEGDNRLVAPKNTADRVNLGLVPTSSASWKVACDALKVTTGGWLHIHENVDSGANQTRECMCGGEGGGIDACTIKKTYRNNIADGKRMVWCAFTARMKKTLQSYLPVDWEVALRHVEYVKSYGPHVDHLVFDVLCRPPVISQE